MDNTWMNNKIDEILKPSDARQIYKDSLKLVVDCQHCGCIKRLTLIDKVLICSSNIIENGNSVDKHLTEKSVHAIAKLQIKENVMESLTNEAEMSSNSYVEVHM